MTEIFILEANLRNTLGHFLNNTVGLKKAFESNGFRTNVFTNLAATEEVLEETSGHRLFRNALCSNTGSGIENTSDTMKRLAEQFQEDLAKIGRVPEDALILVPTALEAQVYGMALWLSNQKLPANVRVVLNFHWDNISTSEQHAQAYKEAFSYLKTVIPGAQLMISAHTPGVVKAIESVAQGFNVQLLPMPQYYGEQKPRDPVGSDKKPIMTVLGRSLPRKGSNSVMDLVYKLRTSLPNLRFRIQSTSTKGLAKWKAHFTPRITLFPSGMSMKQYLDNLQKADIFLLPYSAEDYSDRTSGVFAECAAMGGVAIVPANTWLSRQIDAGRAAGVVFQPDEANAIENAIEKAVKNITELKKKAFITADYWWENVSADAYVKQLVENSFHQEACDSPKYAIGST